MKPKQVYRLEQFHLGFESGASLTLTVRHPEPAAPDRRTLFAVSGFVPVQVRMPNGQVMEDRRELAVEIQADNLADAIERAQLSFDAEIERINNRAKSALLLPTGPAPKDLRGQFGGHR